MTSLILRNTLDRGIAALRANNFHEAEASCREASGDPSLEAEALFYLAASLRAQEKLGEAAEAARRSFVLWPAYETAYLGGEIALQRLDSEDACGWATDLRGADHTQTSHLVRAGELHLRHGLTKAAARYFETVLGHAPDDIGLLRLYCYCEAFHDMSNVIRTLQEFIVRNRNSPRLACLALYILLPYLEKSLRDGEGLPAGGRRPDELHFRFAVPELTAWRDNATQWLASMPENLDALEMMVAVRVANGDIRSAEELLVRIRPHRRNVIASAQFGDIFFDEVAAAATRPDEGLPPVETLVEGDPQGSWVFMACDAAYFERYGWVFARSFAIHRPSAHLHLHVFDLPEERRDSFKLRLKHALGSTSFGVTTEISGVAEADGAACYYHAVRFIRLAVLAERWPGRVCALDADMVFNRSPDLLFDWLADSDVGAGILAGRVEIANQISANLVGIGTTPAGRGFLRSTAGYLAVCRKRDLVLWGVDQTALFAVYAHAEARRRAPGLIGVSAAVYDGSFSPDAAVWVGKCPPDHPEYPRFVARRDALLAGMGEDARARFDNE